jgi:hypothetical protein
MSAVAEGIIGLGISILVLNGVLVKFGGGTGVVDTWDPKKPTGGFPPPMFLFSGDQDGLPKPPKFPKKFIFPPLSNYVEGYDT